MDDERYDLVFKGELVPGAELAQVKQNLQQLFKIDEAQVEKLFAGTAIVLKKNLDVEAANKYRVALKRAGARLHVLASQTAKPATAASEPPARGAARPSASASVSSAAAPARARPQPAPPAGDWRQAITAPNFGLAPPGADLLQENERATVEPVSLDLSAFSVAPMQGDLVAEHERRQVTPVQVDVSALDVLPAGSDILAESERQSPAAVQVDTSGLSVAEPGSRLSEPGKPAPAAPNVSHIRLQD